MFLRDLLDDHDDVLGVGHEDSVNRHRPRGKPSEFSERLRSAPDISSRSIVTGVLRCIDQMNQQRR